MLLHEATQTPVIRKPSWCWHAGTQLAASTCLYKNGHALPSRRQRHGRCFRRGSRASCMCKQVSQEGPSDACLLVSAVATLPHGHLLPTPSHRAQSLHESPPPQSMHAGGLPACTRRTTHPGMSNEQQQTPICNVPEVVSTTLLFRVTRARPLVVSCSSAVLPARAGTTTKPDARTANDVFLLVLRQRWPRVSEGLHDTSRVVSVPDCLVALQCTTSGNATECNLRSASGCYGNCSALCLGPSASMEEPLGAFAWRCCKAGSRRCMQAGIRGANTANDAP